MITITWRRIIIGGNAAVSTSYDMRIIFTALEHVAAYKDVNFVQVVGGGANLTIANVGYNIGTNVLLWTNGRTIYIPKTVNWGTWRAGMLGAMKHELGHAFGSTSHNTYDAGLMRPALLDPLQNWSPYDFGYWYNQLPNKANMVKPWSEPNKWRTFSNEVPTRLTDELSTVYTFGKPSIWRKLMHVMERYVVEPIVQPHEASS
jgi:hypothetical protein